MAVLRLHFQVTGHKHPILAIAACGNLLVTAENGALRIWSFGPSHARSGGPVLLRTIVCPLQSIRALFITPGGSHVVGVFGQDGVVMFDTGDGLVERNVLLHTGKSR